MGSDSLPDKNSSSSAGDTGDGLGVVRDSLADIEATSAFETQNSGTSSAEIMAGFESEGRPLLDSGSKPTGAKKYGLSSLVGKSIGGYQIVAPIGQGGMGRVYRADDSSGRPVAIKLLSPELSRCEDALARFKQEGLIASQINHSNCVFVHRVDEDSGTPFIAMELMTGLTLKDLVNQKGPLPFNEALRLILQCIDGLIEAHSRGMIHRDIKPANCYLDSQGNVKIGDFGLARSLIDDSELTQTGAFIGTPLFASPEQLLGQSVDARSDIYSLTATLYFLLAGKAPFESPNAAQVIAKIASVDPPPFESVDVKVPEELARIVMRGLSRDAAKRYQSFREMQFDLLRLLAPKPETASIARRIAAALADHLLTSLVIGLLAIVAVPTRLLSEQAYIAELLDAAIVFVYYLVAESIFATSLGKAALRIRVADASTGRRPSFRQIFVRASSFTLICISFKSVSLLTLSLGSWSNSNLAQALAASLSTPLTYLALFSTWYYTQRRQFLHDWISRTECVVSAPPEVADTKLDIPEYSPLTTDIGDESIRSLGRFSILSEIVPEPKNQCVRWFLAEDPLLDRSVWIALTGEPDGPQMEQQSSHEDSSMRLRLIEQGSHKSLGRWFAHVAPEGVPLHKCLECGVNFAWPVTSFVLQQVLSHYRSIASRSPSFKAIDWSDWWIDQAGRLSIVDLSTLGARPSRPLSKQELEQQNAHQYQQLLRNVCLLGLPCKHRARRKSRIPNNSYGLSKLPRREELPSLPAIQFCESVASQRYTPSLVQLEQKLKAINNRYHSINSKARFFNALLALAFSIPVMTIVGFILLVPALLFITDSRKELQHLLTLNAVVSADQPEDRWWEGASADERAYWTSEHGQAVIQRKISQLRSVSLDAFSSLGKFEQMLIGRIIQNVDLHETPIFLLSDPSKTEGVAKSSVQDVEINVRGAGVMMSYADTSHWDQKHLMASLAIAQNASYRPYLQSVKEFGAMNVSVYLLIGLAVWNWLSFGGVSSHITGICFASRSGLRMGLIRSAYRAAILFLPVIVLAALVAHWPLHSASDIWWTTQLKRVLFIAPLVYLGSTLIWNNRTIADLLAGTTAISR